MMTRWHRAEEDEGRKLIKNYPETGARKRKRYGCCAPGVRGNGKARSKMGLILYILGIGHI